MNEPQAERWVARFDEPFEAVCASLTEISVYLRDLLPDPSLGPEERLERLARIVPSSVLCSQNCLNARTKLTRIRRRLEELAPEIEGDMERLKYLTDLVNEAVPGDMKFIEKLDTIHDYRRTDIGVSPRHWG